MIRMKFLVVNVKEYEGRDLKDGENAQDDDLVHSDESEVSTPPEVHEETVLHADHQVVDGVLQPAGALLDVDDVEDEDGRHDEVEDKL